MIKKIEDPDDLSTAIKNHKTGDKVNGYLSGGIKKEQKGKLWKLTQNWKGMKYFFYDTGI